MKVSTWDSFVSAILLRKTAFVSVFSVVFFCSYATLAWMDFLPEEPAPRAEVVVNDDNQVAAVSEALRPVNATVATPAARPVTIVNNNENFAILPHTMVIDALDREIVIMNPVSRTIEDLDAALLYGAVRHPDSAALNQLGTVFVLGHSSYLPGVRNPSFQAFNGIQNLRFGDTIRLQADGVEYIYRVSRVYRARAQDVTVPIAGSTQRLVLATCNSFGSADDRYIVESDLVEERNL